MKPIRNLILDMDGVLWRGETPLPGLIDLFNTLRDLQINHVLATNNATKLAPQYVEKLARFGVTIDPARILTSAEATAAYLHREYPAGTPIYVIGESGLRNALTGRGFHVLDANGLVAPDVTVPLVVVGFDRHATYKQLASAALLVRNGARLVGTNPDRTFPHERGQLPGAGSLLAFLEAATGRHPFIVGKPGRALFQEALHRLQATAGETAMVGDRLETDIIGAQAAGLHTILLLSGVTDRDQLAASNLQPDLVLDDIRALTAYLRQQHEPVRP